MRWILVADSTRCRIFAQGKEYGPIREFENLLRPENRQREQDIYTDRQGRTFDSQGRGRHAMERPRTARQQEAARFATAISARVSKARKANKIDGIVLIAEPQFLGRLRDGLEKSSQKLVELEIPANLTQADAAAVRARFMRSLRPV